MTTPTAAPRIAVSRLNIEAELGDGGQGKVFRVTTAELGLGHAAYKRYHGNMLSRLDLEAFNQLVALYHRKDNLSRQWLNDRTAWPLAIVEDGAEPVGFLMRMAPTQFSSTLTLVGQHTSKQLLATEFLLNPLDYLTQRGIQLSDYHRVRLLRELATLLAWLHEHQVAVGDLSPKNLVVSLNPPRCFLLDCDAMRLAGRSVLEQADTPDWEVPTGEERATVASDVFKLGLLAIRLFANDQSMRSADAIPARFQALRELAQQSTRSVIGERSTLGNWITELDLAVGKASRNTQSMPIVSATTPAPHYRPYGPPPRPPIIVPPVRRRRNLKTPIAVIVGLLVVFLCGRSLLTADTDTDNGPNQSTRLSNVDGDQAAASQAAGVNGLLQASMNDRGKLGSALKDANSCRDLAGAAAAMDDVTAGRTQELATARSLPMTSLTNGDVMKVALVGALSHSLAADKYFVSWIADLGRTNCSKSSMSNSNHTMAANESTTATQLKEDFLGYWNPIAASFGYPTRTEPDI